MGQRWPRVPSLSTAPDSGTPLSIGGMSWAARATCDCCLCLCLCPGAGKASIVPHPRAPAACEVSREGRGPSSPSSPPRLQLPVQRCCELGTALPPSWGCKSGIGCTERVCPWPLCHVLGWDRGCSAPCIACELLSSRWQEPSVCGVSCWVAKGAAGAEHLAPSLGKDGQGWGAAVWSLLLRGNNSPGSWSSASWSRDPKPVPCAGVGTGAGLFPPQGGDFAMK